MAKAKNSIAFGVATKVAGILASKSFDTVTNMVRRFGSGNISQEDVSNLQIEIEKLKLKTEETEKKCEQLKAEISQKEDVIAKLKEEKALLSKKLVWVSMIGVVLLVSTVVFAII